MSKVLEALLIASERAACIARSCCKASRGETLLVAEKTAGEANSRFDKDFKTIADVLAQEAARSEITARCPELGSKIRGEESAEINGVSVRRQDTTDATAALLSQLVTSSMAKRMAKAAHCKLNLPIFDEIPKDFPEINLEDIGIWIDPIDGTAEFINGVRGGEYAESGLTCVTVLIGAYLISTGEPVIGIINQPFFNNGQGCVVWGYCYGDIKKWGGCAENPARPKIVLMSSVEEYEVKQLFRRTGWMIKTIPGCGHKLLRVALGEAAAYVLSGDTTYRWDTCGPHAILRARGGDLLCYKTYEPITYNDPIHAETQSYVNVGGIIGASTSEILNEVKSTLQ